MGWQYSNVKKVRYKENYAESLAMANSKVKNTVSE